MRKKRLLRGLRLEAGCLEGEALRDQRRAARVGRGSAARGHAYYRRCIRMKQLPDDPIIESALETGYPPWMK